MPLTIPPFSQYQAPLVPLRGLWNHPPDEGDKFVNAEIEWATGGVAKCVAFSLAGNSPVAISQIVALTVDNAGCGSDVQFIFPDSGFVLAIPARVSGTYPVFTNALTFYGNAGASIAGDRTVIQIHNSMPPPVPVPPSATQQGAGVTGIAVPSGAVAVIPAGTNGTLTSLSITYALENTGAAAAQVLLTLTDGSGHQIWVGQVTVANGATVDGSFNPTGLNLRFVNGLNATVTTTGGTWPAGANSFIVNAYYTTP